MRNLAQTRMASKRSSFKLHPPQKSGCQTFIKTPDTSKPAFLSKAALTDESTPPDKPTKTTFLFPKVLSFVEGLVINLF